jgi:hypothetical protein
MTKLIISRISFFICRGFQFINYKSFLPVLVSFDIFKFTLITHGFQVNLILFSFAVF